MAHPHRIRRREESRAPYRSVVARPIARVRNRVIAGLCVALLVVLAANGGHVHAATFRVNSIADTTDGVCGPATDQCTLREAIERAVATPGRDTIAFDPGVFPRHGAGAISLTSPLPIIADAAGTVVDGAGAGVLVIGGPSVGSGLVFASAPGMPLVGVTVANFVALGFTGTAVHICGGAPPDCADDVSGALVRNVAVGGIGGDGIRIAGDVVTKARVVDSAASNVDGCGIRLVGGRSLVRPRVQGCSALGSSQCGILLRAFDAIVGATIVDSVAVRSDEGGIGISAPDVTKAKLANVVAGENGGIGIRVRGERTNAGTKISDAVASGNGGTGIETAGDMANTSASLNNIVADRNGPFGIAVAGPGGGSKVTRTAAHANHGIGLAVFEGATGAKVSKVLAAGNRTAHGVLLGGRSNVVQQIVASGNADAGILVLEEGGGNTVTKSAFSANNTGVIVRDGGTDNVVEKNVAFGNTFRDLSDGNPSCDGNRWTRNTFRTGSEPCIR